jgi:hypothetical protein
MRMSLPLAAGLRTLQVLACVVLITLLIQQERLVGHRQYWLTRPFGWKELLGAKALFLITMVNVPIVIYHCAQLTVAGINTMYWFSELCWRQELFTAFLILPSAAVAAVASNLGQAILSSIGTFLTLAAVADIVRDKGLWLWLIFDEVHHWGAPLAPVLVVAAAATGVILLQYSSRQEVLARCILLSGAAGLIVWMAL